MQFLEHNRKLLSLQKLWTNSRMFFHRAQNSSYLSFCELSNPCGDGKRKYTFKFLRKVRSHSRELLTNVLIIGQSICGTSHTWHPTAQYALSLKDVSAANVCHFLERNLGTLTIPQTKDLTSGTVLYC